MKPAKIIVVGDFNIHWDVQHAPATKHQIGLLPLLDLQQITGDATREDGRVCHQADNLLKSD